MKIKVPFFKQTTPLNCGPTALRMAIAYFYKDLGIDVFEKLTDIKEGKALSTIQIVRAATALAYGVDFYSISPGFNPENEKLEYYKKYSESGDPEKAEESLEIIKNNGVNVYKESLALEDALGFLSEDSVPIFLLNWKVVKGEDEGYLGHFVVLVGCTEENVIVHNPGLTDGKGFMHIPRDVFDKARKAQGTDEDIVIIYRD